MIHIYNHVNSQVHCWSTKGEQKGKRARAGETLEVHENLLTLYATDVCKFLDDTYASLEGHCKGYKQACEQITREFETSFEAWKIKLSDLKEQGDEMQNHEVELRVQLTEFKKNVNPWMTATCLLR